MWFALTVIVIWTISTLYFWGYSNDDAKRKFVAYIHPEKMPLRTLSSVPQTPPPRSERKTEKHVPQSLYAPPPPEQKTEKHEPQPLYVKIQNQDIYGRCDLSYDPVDFSRAEEMCERDPRCKAFVEIGGLAYLKSCTKPDRDAKEGRTLYVHHTYYKDLRETCHRKFCVV